MTQLIDHNKTIKNFKSTDGLTAGSGITSGTGTVYRASVERFGNLAKTTIFLDLDGLSNGGAAGDIIGANDAANCHLGRIDPAYSGTIVAGSMKCMEVPTTADIDIDVYSADEGTGTENAAITDLTETALVDSGDLTLGGEVIFTALPTAGEYLYLVAGAGATAHDEYGAGKVIIELWGTL